MSELVTFVFTDLVGSVDLKQRMPGAGAAERDVAYLDRVLTPHRQRIEQGLEEARGRVVSTAGDGHFLAFRDTIRAARWAIAVQQSHEQDPLCPTDDPSCHAQVRIGLHIGVPQVDPADSNNFIGRAVDYAARLADRAQAGQILLSHSAAALIEDAGLAGVSLHTHGKLALRGIGDVKVHEILYSGRTPTKPRLDPGEQDRREWTVLPMTMGLTEYSAQAQQVAGDSNVLSTVMPVKRVGNYELLDLLGAGGMGNVYRAKHALFGRTRAVKIIKPELVAAGGESVVQRFYQEIQATGSLEHPNLVVAIESSAPEDNLHFLVMEYIEGLGADELINEHGALDVAEACEITRQAALGLEHLHSRGLVHRDVKPSNVMLTCVEEQSASGAAPRRVGVAKLMDLGLALLVRDDQQRLTRLDQGGMGTGHYMSPEQWRTTSVDIRADIYSLGCTLYHLLHGKPPFADSDLRPEKAHEREPLPPMRVDLPHDLSVLLEQMLAKSPEERPQRPRDVARALAPLARGHQLVDLIDHKTGATQLVRRSQTDTPHTSQAERDTLAPQRRDTAHQTPSQPHDPTRRRVLTVAAVTAGLAAAGLAWVADSLYKQNLAQRRIALEDKANAKASLMAEQIGKRFRELENLAENPKLRGWLEALNQTPEDVSLRVEPQNWLSREKDKRDVDFKSNSWFITDQTGLQIARAPESESIGNSYAHRDYFHGGGHMTEEEVEKKPPAPLRGPHFSRVYTSTSNRKKLKVAFSVPVWNDKSGDQREVIGVIAMSVALGDFSALSEKTSNGSPIEIVLADTHLDYVDEDEQGNKTPQRGLILHHKLLAKYGEEHPRLPDDMLEHILDQRRIDKSHHFPSYKDLLGRRGPKYWGSYAPVVLTRGGDSIDSGGWVVIAQEPAP